MVNVDPNQVIASVASQQISQICDFAVAQFTKLAGGAQVQLRLGLKRYLETLHERLSKVKTLLYRDTPTPIEKLYIEVDLVLGKKSFSSEDLSTAITKQKFGVIAGTAGSGKSMLMRSLFLRALRRKSRIPVFLELRHLNAIEASESPNIAALIHASFGAQPPFDLHQIELGLKNGVFAFFFDGFDEVDPDRRDEVESLILRLSQDYPENEVIVSSRPDDTFASWSAFHVYHVRPLTKGQVISLIAKLEYDVEVKNKFIAEIDERLFDDHEEFLSNPLLATMMLLTYDQFADIPSKVHVFYQQAFETLFQKHDALKAVYRRKNFSGLSIDEFKRAFASFCALTYFAKQLSFNDDAGRSFAQRALDVSGVSCSAENFLRDMLESVCVLQRDGLNLVFVHRSFQEYFTAYFIVAMNGDRAGQFIQQVVARGRPLLDNVVAMCFDMNNDLFEAQWASDAVRRAGATLGVDNELNLGAFIAHLFDEVAVSLYFEGIEGIEIDAFFKQEERSELVATVRTLMRLYDYDYLDWADSEDLRRKDRLVLEQMVDGMWTVQNPNTGFLDLLQELKSRGDGVTSVSSIVEGDGLFDDVSIITDDLEAPENLRWIQQSSIEDVARNLTTWLRKVRDGIDERARSRERLLDGLFAEKRS